MERLSNRLEGAVALWDADGRELAATGPVPFGEPGPYRGRGGHGLRVRLSDGRTVGYRSEPPPHRHTSFFGALALMAAVIAAGAWPLARRLSSRLEGLRDGARAWGEGDLSARVAVHGADEVAEVGRAFNQAADRVQALVDAQRRVLASASHELRSPLARLRLALEMLDDDAQNPLVQGAIRDVDELNDTVGDVLRSARMEAVGRPTHPVDVPLRALLEQAARDGDEVLGAERVTRGDPDLLRRLVRNLVENAHKHGQPPVVLEVTPTGLAVTDAGTPLPEALRERVFEPFFRRDGHAEGIDGGVGLGLALVQQIAHFHGGAARMVDDGGRTRVEVDLP
jgi:signal transduction histidine kinase